MWRQSHYSGRQHLITPVFDWDLRIIAWFKTGCVYILWKHCDEGVKSREKTFWTDLNYWLTFKMYIIDKMHKKRLDANGSNFSPHLDWPVSSEASHFLTRSLSVHLLQLNNERNSLFQQYRNKNGLYDKKTQEGRHSFIMISFTSD